MHTHPPVDKLCQNTPKICPKVKFQIYLRFYINVTCLVLYHDAKNLLCGQSNLLIWKIPTKYFFMCAQTDKHTEHQQQLSLWSFRKKFLFCNWYNISCSCAIVPTIFLDHGITILTTSLCGIIPLYFYIDYCIWYCKLMSH